MANTYFTYKANLFEVKFAFEIIKSTQFPQLGRIIMALRCETCRETAACVLCECRSPACAVCQRCFTQHLTENPGVHSQLSPGSDPECRCSFDSNPASHFCLCNAYICSACLPSHHPPHDDHHVFPLSLLPIYHQDSTGALLRQGELVDFIATTIATHSESLRVKLVRKVADTFDTLQKHLQDCREKALLEVIKYAKEFENDAAEIAARLKEVKYDANWRAKTELEDIIFTENRQLAEKLQGELADWEFSLEEYMRKWDSLSRFKQWKYLLRPCDAQEPTCFLVTNGKTQLFALPSIQPLPVSEAMAWLSGSVLCLPNTEWFYSEQTVCFIISPDIARKATICGLKEFRSFPGLSHYHGSVYLFGGHTKMGVSITAECVDLANRSSRVLAQPMPSSIFSSVPCRHSDFLYFGCISGNCSTFVFHLPSEKFEHSPISYEYEGNSLALALPDDEILVLAQHGLYSYHYQAKECFKLGVVDRITFMSATVPVKYQGVWVFLGRNEEEQMVLAMDERNKEVKLVGEVEIPKDPFLQRLEQQFPGLFTGK